MKTVQFRNLHAWRFVPAVLIAASMAVLIFHLPASAATIRDVSAEPTSVPSPTPGIAEKITFDPSEPSAIPGNQVKITATVRDKNNIELPGATVKWMVADKAHEDYLLVRSEGNTLFAAGLFNDAQSGGGREGGKGAKSRPSQVPVIASYKVEGADKLIMSVLNIELTEKVRPPGPVPPGLKPQVDVMWSVLPQNVVLDNFGSKIKKQYYAIQLVIGNNSGYDLQIASVGFTLSQAKRPLSPTGTDYRAPATGYQLARGSLVRAQEVGIRARVMNTFDALGPVLTGFVPFFKAVNPRANFSQLTNIFSNPFEEGAKLIFPDTTIGQLNRLEQSTFRNDQTARTIIPNNTQITTVAFFPKDFLYMKKDKDRDIPQKVMTALGDLVLVGEQVEYLNRVRLIGDRDVEDAYPISGRVLDECGNGIAEVTLTLTDGPFFKEVSVKTNSEGTYLFEKIPSGSNYKVVATKTGATFTSEGGDAFLLDGSRTNVNFRGRQATYTISGKVLAPTGQGIKDIEVTLSDGKTDSSKTKEDGSYAFVGLLPGLNYVVKPTNGQGFTFDPAVNTRTFGVLNCNQPGANFNGVPAAPSPSPTP